MRAASLQNVAMGASLVVAMLMLFGKLVAYVVSGSTAILSDAAESVVHIMATAVAAASLWYARQPASRQHPYGHGKVAYFSAGFEGGLILTAAIYILYVAAGALILGPTLRVIDVGLAITAGLCLVNLFLGVFLIYVGKTYNALILVANGRHVLTDMWTSAGVVVGVAAVWMTGIEWLDPAVAIIVGLNILVTAFALMKRSFRGLLDEADPEKTRLLLACLDRATQERVLSGFHQLRHRQSNDQMWIEVHMLVPEAMSAGEAHARVTGVEESIRQLFPEFQVHVTSHIEPLRHEVAHPGGHPGLVDPLKSGQ